MARFGRVLGWSLLAALILYFAGPTTCAYRDANTKHELLQAVAQELPPRASMAEMDRFMRRHTEMYAFTSGGPYGLPDDEFGGLLPQSKLDKVLLDRVVSVSLTVDRQTKTFKSADVKVAYTFL